MIKIEQIKAKYKKLKKSDLELISEYLKYLESFLDRAALKFAAGRIEHSKEDPMMLDYDYEIEEERMDILSYQFLKERALEFNGDMIVEQMIKRVLKNKK